MPESANPVVTFDVLLRAGQARGEPSVQEIARFKPDPGDIERCRRWLAQRGVTAHATDFGLACSCPPALFEQLFGVRLAEKSPAADQAPFEAIGAMRPPPEIGDLIEQVTLTVAPQLF